VLLGNLLIVLRELSLKLKSDHGADARTNWADERTQLAKERTFAAWIRTGLSSIAVGLGIVKLLHSVEPRWLLQAIGIIFASTGGVVFIVGFKTYHTIVKKLEQQGFKVIPSYFMAILTCVLLIGTFLALVVIILD
jgi:putative membrane protein